MKEGIKYSLVTISELIDRLNDFSITAGNNARISSLYLKLTVVDENNVVHRIESKL
jgi:hypothetical protein